MLSLYIIREQETFFKIGFQQHNTTVLKEQITIRNNNLTANNDNNNNNNNNNDNNDNNNAKKCLFNKKGNINLRDYQISR